MRHLLRVSAFVTNSEGNGCLTVAPFLQARLIQEDVLAHALDHLLERHPLAQILVEAKVVNQVFQTRTAQHLLCDRLQSEVNTTGNRGLDKRFGNLLPLDEYGRGGLIDIGEEHGHTRHRCKHCDKDEDGQPLAPLPYLPSRLNPPMPLGNLYAIGPRDIAGF